MLFLLACVHVPEAETPPPAIEGATVEWFNLTGTDKIDLLESCLSRCPRDEAGVTVASLTTWELRWSWLEAPGDGCVVAGATVDASVSVALPRWDPPPEADPALVEEWSAWHSRLRHHEQGHVDVVHAYTHDAEARLVDAGCDGVVDAGAALLAGVRVSQGDYDIETANGHRQGAAFWGIEGRAR